MSDYYNTPIGFGHAPDCEDCGLPQWDDGTSTHSQEICKCDKKYGMMGWICPNCGAGMSPFTDRCGCKDQISWGSPTCMFLSN